MKQKTPLYLADKTKLVVGDIVVSNMGIDTISEIRHGGCIGEYICSTKNWLSNATLLTADESKSYTYNSYLKTHSIL